MKRKDFLVEIKGLSGADLRSKAKGLAEEVMKLRFRKSMGQLEKSHHFKTARRNLARTLTRSSAAGKPN